MSKQKKSATSSLSPDELKAKASEIEEQLFKLRMQKVTGQLANTSAIRVARKELARVKTFQTAKQRLTAEVVKGK